jgi:hypothetical protein
MLLRHNVITDHLTKDPQKIARNLAQDLSGTGNCSANQQRKVGVALGRSHCSTRESTYDLTGRALTMTGR